MPFLDPGLIRDVSSASRATRDMLFELGSELAGALVPGGGVAVKVIEKIVTDDDRPGV